MNKKLSDLIKEFLEYKKQNGYVYTTAGYHLNKYLDFSINHSPDENIPCKDTVNAFLNKYARTRGNLYNIVAALRKFSRYLIGLGYTSAYVIPRGKVSLPTPVQPYLFTDDEIAAFFIACDSLQHDCHVPKRHIVLPAMYRLLYCCGLRCKEVRTLKSENVHLEENYMDILQSKRYRGWNQVLGQLIILYDERSDTIPVKRKEWDSLFWKFTLILFLRH